MDQESGGSGNGTTARGVGNHRLLVRRGAPFRFGSRRRHGRPAASRAIATEPLSPIDEQAAQPRRCGKEYR